MVQIVWDNLINFWPALVTAIGFISVCIGCIVGFLTINQKLNEARKDAIARETAINVWRTWVTNEISWMNTALVACLECSPSIDKDKMLEIFKMRHTDDNGKIVPPSNPIYPICALEQYIARLLEGAS